MHLPPGLYDLVLTTAVARSLESASPAVGDVRDLDADEAPERLAEVLGAELRRIADPADITDRPMSITWTLQVPLPAKLFSEYSVLRG